MTLADFLAARRPLPNAGLVSVPFVSSLRDTAASPIPGYPDAGGGAQVGYHVTDDPARALAAIRRGDLVASYGPKGRHAELGPGLYLSHAPGFWVSRARGKWAFLGAVEPAALGRLVEALRAEVEDQVRSRYVARWEGESALRLLGDVASGRMAPTVLTDLAGQPYNVQFWREDFLRGVGIEPAPPPGVLELEFFGTFAALTHAHPPPESLRLLRRAGLAGVFTPAGFATNPELVVWSGRSVRAARAVPWR